MNSLKDQQKYRGAKEDVTNQAGGPNSSDSAQTPHWKQLPLILMTKESGSHFEFKRTVSTDRLLTGPAKGLVSPTGFEPVLLP